MRTPILLILIVICVLGVVVYSAPDIRVNGDGSITITDTNETFRVYIRSIGDSKYAYYGNYTNETTITLPTGRYEIIIVDSSGNHSFIIENKLLGKSIIDTMIANPIPVLFFILAFILFTWRRSIIPAVFLFMFTINMVMSYGFNPELSFSIIIIVLLYVLLLVMYRR